MKDKVRGCLAFVVMLLMLAIVIMACIVGYLFYAQGFSETTKTYLIAFFCTGFVWWVVASIYRTVRR